MTKSPIYNVMILALVVISCESNEPEYQPQNELDVSRTDVHGDDGDAGNNDPFDMSAIDPDGGDEVGPEPPNRFEPGLMPAILTAGGYIDSIFLTKAGDRLYFTHSIYPANVLEGSATMDDCAHKTVSHLPGHVSVPGLDWNTDLYYVEWNGTSWTGPFSLEEPINSLGMECCVWLNDDETEIIFARDTDLDGDGTDGDVGTTPSGNYRSVRSSKNDAWSTPVPLPGDYGTENQGRSNYRYDIHKSPSGNLYLWKHDNGDRRLLFGERTGGTYDEPVYAEPQPIPGSVHEDTQIWVNDAETVLVYNHRDAAAQTELFRMTRATATDPWQAPELVPTAGFEDGPGQKLWGEPTFDETEEFLLFVRFNTTDSMCYSSELMYAEGQVMSGFGEPVHLN